MALIFGKKMAREEVLRRVGDMSQIAGARPCELSDGPARGVRAVDVHTGSGLRYTVLPDRGMDIGAAEHNGRSLCWHSGTGVTHPAYFKHEGVEWLWGFYGGLMVTCGLTSAGAPSVDEGEALGLHGRASNTPAREVCVRTGWEGDEYFVAVSGKVVEARVFGAHLCLERTITSWAGQDRIAVRDQVTNLGHAPCPHMMLYHCNFGYPAVAEASRLIAPSKTVAPRDDEAAKGKEQYDRFGAPHAGWAEKVYYHELYSAKGETAAGIVNPALGFGAYLKYRPSQLPLMVEWKQIGEGTYAVGLEPSTNRVGGREAERAAGRLRMLAPGETAAYELEIGALPDERAVKEFQATVEGIARGRKPRVSR